MLDRFLNWANANETRLCWCAFIGAVILTAVEIAAFVAFMTLITRPGG